MRFRCLFQTFEVNAPSTVALVQDTTEKLHIVRYKFDSDDLKAKGSLEIVETLGKLQ